MKFNIDIGAWPFKSINNTLHFGVALTSSSSEPSAQTQPPSASITNITDQMTKNVHNSLVIGRAQLIAPTNAFIDDVQTLVSQGITSESGDSIVTHWIFPYYTSDIHYDPVLSSSTTLSTSSAGSLHSISVALIATLLVSFII